MRQAVRILSRQVDEHFRGDARPRDLERQQLKVGKSLCGPPFARGALIIHRNAPLQAKEGVRRGNPCAHQQHASKNALVAVDSAELGEQKARERQRLGRPRIGRRGLRTRKARTREYVGGTCAQRRAIWGWARKGGEGGSE